MVSGWSPRRTASFKTTRWSMVIAAAGDPSPESEDALARLCQSYWLPVYAFIRRRGSSPDDAADLTQEFFARILEKRDLADAQRDRGRFRTFLLAAVTHFLANQSDRRLAVKRGGRVRTLPLEIESGEERLSFEPRHDATPEHLFERQWALALLATALARVHDEYEAGGRARLFERLQSYLSDERPRVPYAEAARELGVTEGTVKVSVHRLRRRFGAVLRDEVAHTLSSPSDIDGELRYLLRVVSG
jgi:RNA polymerase sigma-70 factor (ECF subfamily)